MNCQELARELEEQDLDHMPAALRGLAEASLAGCPESRRDVQLHRSLTALPVPPLSSGQIDEWRTVALREAFVRTERHRRRARLYGIGALALGAVLAAIAIIYLRQPPASKALDTHHEEVKPAPPTHPQFHQP